MPLLTLYRPNFCSACGAKIVRLSWRLWTSRRFCSKCSPTFRQQQWGQPILSLLISLVVGILIGNAIRPTPPPLVIQRVAATSVSNNSSSNVQPAVAIEDEVYICGARTKKGTPCSRRVHGPVRCWQHKGLPAMLPLEKLKIKA